MEISFEHHLATPIIPLAIALYIIGIILKRTPFIKDWLIPWLLLFIGCISAALIMGFSIDSIIQGILACGAAVLSNQLYKQTSKSIS